MDCYTLLSQYGALAVWSHSHTSFSSFLNGERCIPNHLPVCFSSRLSRSRSVYTERRVCVCYNITLGEHNTQQRQQQQQQWMRRTGYSNKIYFSCQNLTTCRLYCIQISGSHVRLAVVRMCARSIVQQDNPSPGSPSPGSLLNQTGPFFFLSLLMSDLYPNPSFDRRLLIVSHVKRDT